jgi:hypothetical protein
MQPLQIVCQDAVRRAADEETERLKAAAAAVSAGDGQEGEEDDESDIQLGLYSFVPLSSHLKKSSSGTNCKRNACTVTYGGSEMSHKPCFYHPGVPVFHEGLKYWSCCKRKTTEFDTFMAQEGCARGEKHQWKLDKVRIFVVE